MLTGLAAAALLLALAACGGGTAAAEGTIEGVVVEDRPCSVESGPAAAGPRPSPSSGSGGCARVPLPDASVRIVDAASEEARLTVTSGADGRFSCSVPDGLYRLEASLPSVGHGVPVDVRVSSGSTQRVTLRIGTGVQ